MRWNYLSIPKYQWLHRWSLRVWEVISFHTLQWMYLLTHALVSVNPYFFLEFSLDYFWRTGPIPPLLMPWNLASPRHQQMWYCLCTMWVCLCSKRNSCVQTHRHHFIVENASLQINSTRKHFHFAMCIMTTRRNKMLQARFFMQNIKTVRNVRKVEDFMYL